MEKMPSERIKRQSKVDCDAEKNEKISKKNLQIICRMDYVLGNSMGD